MPEPEFLFVECVATNDHGKAESQVDLMVEAMPEAMKAQFK